MLCEDNFSTPTIWRWWHQWGVMTSAHCPFWWRWWADTLWVTLMRLLPHSCSVCFSLAGTDTTSKSFVEFSLQSYWYVYKLVWRISNWYMCLDLLDSHIQAKCYLQSRGLLWPDQNVPWLSFTSLNLYVTTCRMFFLPKQYCLSHFHNMSGQHY
jgi:hypothetical protein